MDLEKEAFFSRMTEQGLALTFDDVRLQTRHNHNTPLPETLSLESYFSRHVELKVPFISAAMDTVTTSDMAIAMAKLGGLGVIHAGLSLAEQKHEVRRVKRHLNGLIEDPVTLLADRSLASVLKECEDRQFDFRTFPVIDGNNRFVGLLTQNDFDFSDDLSELVENVMTPAAEVRSAPEGTTINEAHILMKRHKKKTIPLIKADGTIDGMYVLSDVKRITLGNPDQYNVDAKGRLRVAAAVPSKAQVAVERVKAMGRYLDVVVVDTADGDSFHAFDTLEALKEEFPELDVVVGNITDGFSAKELAEAGADGIKVGQGGGSICSTRPETGIGMPQVTAVYECAKAVEPYGIPVCSDGGIRNRGDVPIAIAAGARSVMMGLMLAGTMETPGELITLENGSRFKKYRGMASASALRDSADSRGYGDGSSGDPLPEGVETLVPYKGPVLDTIDLCIKALRKSMRYVKAPDIEWHRHNARFVRITNAGLNESHPHDIIVSSR